MPDVIGTLFHKEIPYGGVKGDKGDTGATPNISATASVDSTTGTPSVNVVKTGTAENPSFAFDFHNLKGEKGDPGSGASVSWGEIDGDIEDQADLSAELAKKYDENDTAETNIADDDYFPFYDTSATEKRKTLFSTLKTAVKTFIYGLMDNLPTSGSDNPVKSDGVYTAIANRLARNQFGTIETDGAASSAAYGIGDAFMTGQYVSSAKTAITSGATLTRNTNYVRTTIAALLNQRARANTKTLTIRYKNYGNVALSSGVNYLDLPDECKASGVTVVGMIGLYGGTVIPHPPVNTSGSVDNNYIISMRTSGSDKICLEGPDSWGSRRLYVIFFTV